MLYTFKYTAPDMDLSNFITLTADKKKIQSPRQSGDILKTFWILYWQIEFVLAYLMNIVSAQPIPTWSLMCLQCQSMLFVGYSLCGLKSSNLTPNTHPDCLWKGNYQILTGISFLGIDSPLPNAEDLRNLWSYVFCKGVQMTTVANHLDSAGFNTIAKK